jgi:hypothetical protein
MKRKKTNAKRKPLAVVVKPVVGRFLVVSSPKVDDPLKEVTGDIEGTFDTIQQAENYIREEGRDSFNLDGANEGRNEDWCSAMFICEVVAVRKAIPIVSVRVEVTDAVPTPNAGLSGGSPSAEADCSHGG